MKFDKLVNLYLENIAGSPGSGHNIGMKNKEVMIMNAVRKNVHNWQAGAKAGDLGIDDLIDVFSTILTTYGDEAWNEIDMTLQSLVDDNYIEEDEQAWITKTLLGKNSA